MPKHKDPNSEAAQTTEETRSKSNTAKKKDDRADKSGKGPTGAVPKMSKGDVSKHSSEGGGLH